jgi:arginine N-succinyltransferase
MYVIRPVQKSDLKALMTLLEDSGHGLTSLPKDEEVIARRIARSELSFAHREENNPSGEIYLFVMEDIFTTEIVGVSGIVSKIGGFEPYYFYRLEEENRSSDMLKVNNTVRTLHVEKIHSGPAEICSLFLNPKYRNSQNGRFLSLSRFLFIANNRNFFEDHVIAEMRGRVDENGHSPFWDAVGKKFFKIDFTTADYLTIKTKKWIEELLPEYPIIVDLLPQAAQDVVGEVHPHTVPAKKILEKEGFSFNGLVGPFEPGPILAAEIDKIRTIKDSKEAIVDKVDDIGLDEKVYIISTGEGDFRSIVGPIKEENGKAQISKVEASALKLKIGDKIRFSTLKAEV